MLASLPLCLVGWCWSVGWGISLLNIASDNKIFLLNIANNNKISLLNIASDNKIQYDIKLVYCMLVRVF